MRVNHNGTRMDTLKTTDTDDLGDVSEVMSHIKQIHARGTGVLGMKLVGEGRFTKPEDRDAAMRFVMKSGCGGRSHYRIQKHLAKSTRPSSGWAQP